MARSALYCKSVDIPVTDYTPRIGTTATEFTTTRNKSWYRVLGDVVEVHVDITVSTLNSPADTSLDATIQVDLPFAMDTTLGEAVGAISAYNINFGTSGYLSSYIMTLLPSKMIINQSNTGAGGIPVPYTSVVFDTFILQASIRYRR